MIGNSTATKYGIVLLVSGPSGTGKTTVCNLLLRLQPELYFSISCTTRRPRRNEIDGRDYRFVDEALFQEKIEAGEFLEFAEVHGCYYGTLRSEVEQHLLQGRDVLLDVDVAGGRQIRRKMMNTEFAACVAYVFIAPPSVKEMAERLHKRGTEDEQSLARRLHNAREELSAWREYDYVIVNDDLQQAVARLQSVLEASRNLTASYRLPPWAHDDASQC